MMASRSASVSSVGMAEWGGGSGGGVVLSSESRPLWPRGVPRSSVMNRPPQTAWECILGMKLRIRSDQGDILRDRKGCVRSANARTSPSYTD